MGRDPERSEVKNVLVIEPYKMGRKKSRESEDSLYLYYYLYFDYLYFCTNLLKPTFILPILSVLS